MKLVKTLPTFSVKSSIVSGSPDSPTSNVQLALGPSDMRLTNLTAIAISNKNLTSSGMRGNFWVSDAVVTAVRYPCGVKDL